MTSDGSSIKIYGRRLEQSLPSPRTVGRPGRSAPDSSCSSSARRTRGPTEAQRPACRWATRVAGGTLDLEEMTAHTVIS